MPLRRNATAAASPPKPAPMITTRGDGRRRVSRQYPPGQISTGGPHETVNPSGAPVALDAARMSAYSVGLPKKKLPWRVVAFA